MHIGIGEFEGRELVDSPKRPTTARVLTIKEEIFTIIGSRITEAQVLDFNDDNGMFGIEALSRGAKCCKFINAQKEDLELVKKNLEVIGVADDGLLENEKVMDYLERNEVTACAKEKYDIAFLQIHNKDEIDLVSKLLERQDINGLTVVVYPHMPDFEIPNVPDFEICETREFEDRRIAVYLKNQGQK